MFFTSKDSKATRLADLYQLRDKLTALPPLKQRDSRVTRRIPCSPQLPVLNETEEFENLSSSLRKTKRCGVSLKYHSDSEAQVIKVMSNKTGGLPIDDDEVEVIEGTPSYVYDRKKRVRAKSTNASNIGTEAIVQLDATIVDEYFSQHANKNNTEKIINPSLASQINATSSEGSDDDCKLIEDQFSENEISVTNLPFEARISDRVNIIVDEVCSILDKCADSLGQQERQVDNLRFAKNIEKNTNIASDIFKTSKDMNRKLKAQKDKNIYEDNPDKTKKVTTKFNQSVTAASKMNSRKKTAKNDKDRIDVGKSNELTESTNTTPPVNSTKSILIRKKRKLFSPEDEEIENNEITDPKTTAKHRQSNVNKTPIATCDRELENARKSHSRIPEKSRASTQEKKSSKKARCSAYSDAEDPPFQVGKRTRTSRMGSTTTMSRRERPANPVNYNDYSAWASSSEDDKNNITIKPKTVRKNKARRCKVERTSRNQPVLSPKTRKFNEMFDKIKENIVNDEKITIVEKRSCRKDLSLYNLSSESEDGDFKKRRIQAQKCVSSSSIDSSAAKRRRLSRVNYSENSSEDEGKRTLKVKTVNKGKSRRRKANKILKLNLSDERMRLAQQESLETSFVNEKADANDVQVPEPALQQAPALEVMPPDKSNDDVVETEVSENKKDPPNKLDIFKIKKENYSSNKPPKVTVTKSKENIKEVSKEKDSATVSPLPGLVVETERTRAEDLPSAMEANLLQKLKKIYTEDQYLNEEDDTRNMLLNADENDNAVCEPTEMIETVLMSDALSEKSIATVGPSPITGHNDLNESPPNVELLDEEFQHRDVNNEGMSESIAEFLVNIRNQLQTSRSIASPTSAVIPITRISTKKSTQSNLCAKKLSSGGSVNKSMSNAEPNKSNPKVVLTRMPSPEIESKIPDPVGTPKSKVSAVLIATPKSHVSVVLTRLSSNEIEKYLTPSRTQKSSNTRPPEEVLKRISIDEINKRLPMSEYKNKESEEKAKKYNTRQTSKAPQITISTNVVEKKIRPNISPVKLNFDIVNLTAAHHRVTRDFRTRSSTKSMQSRTNTNKEPLKTDSIQSSKAKANKNDQALLKGSQETVTTVTTTSKPDNQNQRRPISVDVSDMNKSIASVQDWFKRNAASSSSSAADNDAVKEILSLVAEDFQTTLAEAFQTTLAEIQHDTSERLTAVFLKDQEVITSIEKEQRRIQEMIETFKKEKMKRDCEVIRVDTEKKERMFKLLLEDIPRLLRDNLEAETRKTAIQD